MRQSDLEKTIAAVRSVAAQIEGKVKKAGGSAKSTEAEAKPFKQRRAKANGAKQA